MASLASSDRPYDWEVDPRNQPLDSGRQAEVEELLDRTAALIVAMFFIGAALVLFGLVVYHTYA